MGTCCVLVQLMNEIHIHMSVNVCSVMGKEGSGRRLWRGVPLEENSYLASGFLLMYSIASWVDLMLSASVSGISMLNSSSIAITTSTASKLSSPRSVLNVAVGVTFLASTLSKFLTTFITLSMISFSAKECCAE